MFHTASMDASQVLVLILAIALFVLLVMSIIFVYYLLKVVRNVRDITHKADEAADNLITFSQTVRKGAIPASAAGFVSMIVRQVLKRKDKKK